ncbi:hypothetical protein D3C85_1639900 [compost metagenome]
MTGLLKLVVSRTCDNLRLEQFQRLVIDGRAECTRSVDITFHTDNVGRIYGLSAVSINRTGHCLFVDIRYNQLCAFFMQILAQRERDIPDTLHSNRLAGQ